MYRLIPIYLSFMIIGAHFLRNRLIGVALMCFAAGFALQIKRKWVANVFTILLVIISIDWVSTAFNFYMERKMKGEPYMRMLIIIGVVSLISLCSTLIFKQKKMKERYSANSGASLAGTFAFFITFITLSYMTMTSVAQPLLLDRFLPAGGIFQAFWLGIYAGVLADFMQNRLVSQYIRPKVWLFFGIIFFAQLLLGLVGLKKFLMTGAPLTLPVPMTILAGPIFRDGGLLMLIVFGATVILTGPAWCSFLCYFGAFDHYASCKQKKPGELPKWSSTLRIGIIAVVVGVAYLLRYFGLPTLYAASLTGAFGIGGIAVIWYWSRKAGVMTHCTTYCPVGFLATTLGKLSPFRVRIDDNCDSCGSCSELCRYGALTKTDIANKKPGDTCTLCGDCSAACENGSIDYSFPLLSPMRSRALFITIVIALHAIFLGLVRI